MFKAVIFDLGGVYFTDGRKIAAEKIAKEFNLDPKKVADVMVTDLDHGKKYRRAEITADEFWEAVKEILFIDAPGEDLNRIWCEAYEPIAETVEIVKKLKKKGIKLYYLSDSVKERIDYLEDKHTFLENFDDGIFSHKVHLTKRDGPRIFRMALTETGFGGDDVVFVDDSRDYCETAKSLGMQVIHFKNPKQLEADLKKLGATF